MVKLRETRLALDNCSRVTLTKYLKLDVKSCTDVFEVAQKLYSSSLNHVECTAKLVRALLCTRGLGHLVSTCFSPGKLLYFLIKNNTMSQVYFSIIQ